MKTLIISAFAAAALATAASTANAFGNCPPWMCSSNGTQLTGIALPNIALGGLKAAAGCLTWACGTPGNGTRLTGVVSKGAVAQPVSAVILPSGEVVGLR